MLIWDICPSVYDVPLLTADLLILGLICPTFQQHCLIFFFWKYIFSVSVSVVFLSLQAGKPWCQTVETMNNQHRVITITTLACTLELARESRAASAVGRCSAEP